MIKWLILIAVVVVICVAEWMRELFTFKVTHYNVRSEKLNSLTKEKTVIFLSDLHNNHYGQNNRKLVEAIKAQNPDLILVGGDMLIGEAHISFKAAREFMREIVDICPIYYANGNHEYRMKIAPEKYGLQYEQYKKALVDMGVHFLENEHVDFEWGTCPVRIYGLEIPGENYQKFRKVPFSVEQMTDCIGIAKQSQYQILLAHNPIYTDTYLEWGADLVLAGHLHGGIVRIPGLGGIITPQFGIFPKYSGEMTEKDGKTVVVSKGLGTHSIRIRFLNPAEVIVLHMGGKEK